MKIMHGSLINSKKKSCYCSFNQVVNETCSIRSRQDKKYDHSQDASCKCWMLPVITIALLLVAMMIQHLNKVASASEIHSQLMRESVNMKMEAINVQIISFQAQLSALTWSNHDLAVDRERHLETIRDLKAVIRKLNQTFNSESDEDTVESVMYELKHALVL